ncbi:hypothetical protein CEXT_203531 [Caerostris extrusa]|uniref:Uncharacterized protein n=1 Tax=Caerostris extrusa TaxID=172846 RepID=A0AAV4WHQ1_CAEEX|nr:hypothetical protein CEXT_203531 [Caerostris extrusa]
MNTPEETTEVYSQVSSLFLKRGFELRKWRSNSFQVLRKLNVIKEENRFEIHGGTKCKVLEVYPIQKQKSNYTSYLHASEQDYATLICCRQKSASAVAVNLLASKTKVAPVK